MEDAIDKNDLRKNTEKQIILAVRTFLPFC